MESHWACSRTSRSRNQLQVIIIIEKRKKKKKIWEHWNLFRRGWTPCARRAGQALGLASGSVIGNMEMTLLFASFRRRGQSSWLTVRPNGTETDQGRLIRREGGCRAWHVPPTYTSPPRASMSWARLIEQGYHRQPDFCQGRGVASRDWLRGSLSLHVAQRGARRDKTMFSRLGTFMVQNFRPDRRCCRPELVGVLTSVLHDVHKVEGRSASPKTTSKPGRSTSICPSSAP